MKRSEPIKHARPPSFLSIASLASELDLSETTIREMVDKGILPRPIRLGSSPRWDWSLVRAMLAGVANSNAEQDPYMAGAKNATQKAR